MTKVFPFRALRYDPARVALQQVVTQPYDKITPELQEAYYARDPHNLVRIELGKKQHDDSPVHNIYTRAAKCLQEWRRIGILRREAQPSFYLYTQTFSVPGTGEQLERRGFIGLGQLEDYRAGVIFRHEQTLARPKADRLELLRATHAHTGQLFMVYSDPQAEVEKLLSPSGPPDIDVVDDYGVRHRVWDIRDSGVLREVSRAMQDKKLVIADGHHRYETALAYRNERREEARIAASGPGREKSGIAALAHEAPYERAMMTFFNMDSPGLVILPTHRVVHGLASFNADTFLRGAAGYFEMAEVPGDLDAREATELLRRAGEQGTSLLVLTAGRKFLFRAKPGAGLEFLHSLSPRQQDLDVVKLHKILLEGVLEISEEDIREQKHLSYVRDSGEAMRKAYEGANVVFLMNPVTMAQVRDIAFAGDVMPQKSTDFYPKLLSGLTIYALD
jgi:uncharacterized protein (DUF1015 family)